MIMHFHSQFEWMRVHDIIISGSGSSRVLIELISISCKTNRFITKKKNENRNGVERWWSLASVSTDACADAAMINCICPFGRSRTEKKNHNRTLMCCNICPGATHSHAETHVRTYGDRCAKQIRMNDECSSITAMWTREARTAQEPIEKPIILHRKEENLYIKRFTRLSEWGWRKRKEEEDEKCK